jgi:hypothetical protein
MISTVEYAVGPVQYEYEAESVYQSEDGFVQSEEYPNRDDHLSARNITKEWAYITDDQHRHSLVVSKLAYSNLQTHMSPPLTPKASREAISEPEVQVDPTFHNYLRAFYHFHPTSTVSSSGDESSITVPINQGDVILVHSVHPNGWADGTLLTSGARGWLPTNYCEPFEPLEIRNLLNALTNLWDMVRSTEHESLLVFSRQDYVRGMIAGVRFFLVSSWTFENIY